MLSEAGATRKASFQLSRLSVASVCGSSHGRRVEWSEAGSIAAKRLCACAATLRSPYRGEGLVGQQKTIRH